MLKALQNRGQAVRIMLFAIISVIALSMLITMLPGSITSPSASPDVVVEVGGLPITASEVRNQIRRANGGRPVMQALEPFYARQHLDQMITDRMLEVEAQRLGIEVTRQEQAERIRMLVPSAKAGDMQLYPLEVGQRFQMEVGEFEEAVRKSLVAERFALMVTDGVTVSAEEINEELRRRNEKVTLEFALVKPDDLESKISVSAAELAAHFEKNKASYQIPEKRLIRYALLDTAQARATAKVTEDELRAYYTQNIAQYRSEDRAKVSHILFKTVGKPDAEVEEIRKKAEDIAKQARGKAKFEDLAKQHSEDTSKDTGGDLGWIVHGQTVPDFEKAAFSLPLKTISDPIKTEYGFHIIRVNERESARTKPFEEVRNSILPVLQNQKADRAVSDLADKMGSTIRQNPRISLEELSKQFQMTLGEAGPSAVREAWGALGPSNELDDAIFRLRQGELSSPIQMPQGYIVLSLNKVEPAHQAVLAEVRDRVMADVRGQKAIALAKTVAEEIAAKAKLGSLAAAAKASGITTKTSEAFARNGSVPDIGSARQVAAAFNMNVGETSPAVSLGANWVVYRVNAKESLKPDQIIAQTKEVEQNLLQSKRQLAYESFREALKKRLVAEGKIVYNQQNHDRLIPPNARLGAQ